MRNTVRDVCERELRRFTALVSEIQHDRDKMFNFPDYIICPDCFCSISPLPKLFHLRFAFIIEILTRNQSEIRIQCDNVYTTSVESETAKLKIELQIISNARNILKILQLSGNEVANMTQSILADIFPLFRLFGTDLGQNVSGDSVFRISRQCLQ